MPRSQLVELSVEGLGPITSARLEFASGLNVLTGETGAGKTLLVGALSLCLGATDSRGVREDRAVRTRAIVRDGDIEVAFGREGGDGGRWRATIDDVVTSAAGLRERAAQYIELFGQHDSHRLRGRGEARRLLDAYGDISDRELVTVRSRLHELERLREQFGGDRDTRLREEEFIDYQLAEIDRAGIADPDELEIVLRRLHDVSTMRDNHTELLAAIEELDGDDRGALTAWRRAARRIPEAGTLGELRRRLENVALEAQETVGDLARAAEEWHLDPAELASLEERAALLGALARKFGGRLSGVLLERDRLVERRDDLARARDALAEADRETAVLATQEAALAGELRAERERVARRFSGAVNQQLPRVALEHARFEVRVDGDDGSAVEFLFADDGRSPLGALGKLASGGELARILLAVSLVSLGDDVVAVFDEVDAGVGGNVAQQIGECLRELAEGRQVIVVTHLASIAAKAQRHFVVSRNSGALGDGNTSVRVVDGDERVAEVSRMLAGASSLEESRALAERLLGAAHP